MTTDAHHVTAPHPEGEGMIRAITQALHAAGMAPGDIGYVNAHGTGTLQNDRTEALALRRVFGDDRVLVSSTKSLVGHTMAAAGSVEAVATWVWSSAVVTLRCVSAPAPAGVRRSSSGSTWGKYAGRAAPADRFRGGGRWATSATGCRAWAGLST